jgi:hypothetical protein
MLLGLGTAPLGSLADLAERHFGVDVECGAFGPQISGMCVHADPIALILANTHLTTGHLRFTLAHELAHHLLGDPREVVVEDKLSGESTIERRANAFAAHLLMPADEVHRVIADRPISDQVLAGRPRQRRPTREGQGPPVNHEDRIMGPSPLNSRLGHTGRGPEGRQAMTSSGAERPMPAVQSPRRLSVAEQARLLGTTPIESADTYALDGVWESDEEVEEFIRFTRAARQVEGA